MADAILELSDATKVARDCKGTGSHIAKIVRFFLKFYPANAEMLSMLF